MLWSLQDQPNIVSEAVSRPNFDQSTKNLVRFIDTVKSGYKRKLGTAPPRGVEITKNAQFAYNFWKHCSNCVISLSLNSLGYADSDNVSFVNFHECVCQPYWRKWKPVFSLLLIQICQFCAKSNHTFFGPTRKEMTEQIFWYSLPFPRKRLSEDDRTLLRCLMLVILAF